MTKILLFIKLFVESQREEKEKKFISLGKILRHDEPNSIEEAKYLENLMAGFYAKVQGSNLDNWTLAKVIMVVETR